MLFFYIGNFCLLCYFKEIHPDDPRCNSFEYNDNGVCILSRETAVPLGNGQLKQKSGTAYYEKVCIDTKLTQ